MFSEAKGLRSEEGLADDIWLLKPLLKFVIKSFIGILHIFCMIR